MRVLVTGVAGQLGCDVMKELARRGDTGIGTDLATALSACRVQIPEYAESRVQRSEEVPECMETGAQRSGETSKYTEIEAQRLSEVPERTETGVDGMRAVIGGMPMEVRVMDITDAAEVEAVVAETGVDAVIHCAAYTAVDAAEDNEALCQRVNVRGTKHIADACKKLGIKMMYISTDYVFDGEGERPWEPEDDRHPLNVYGRTKGEGELAVQDTLEQYFIVRIAWVFGKNGKNFIRTMLDLAKTHDTLTVVNDQFGSPTYTKDLAVLLADMIRTEKYGIYHATNEGICTWYEFACEIFRQAGVKVHVTPVTSDAFPVKAKRPHNSRMSKDKLEQEGFFRLPAWQDAVGRYLKELEEVRKK